MRKILLFAMMLFGLAAMGQTSTADGNCKAQFKFAVNTEIMTLVPATAINFYDRSEGKVTAWFWDFGDGNTSNEQNPMFIFNHPIGGPTVKISPYRKVSLTILTADNCKSYYSETINTMDGSLYEPPTCVARFKYYLTAFDSIGGSASFQLTNLSEGDSLKYLWQFDDGKTSTEKEPTVTFDLQQTERKVCLTVTGKNNCTETFCDAVYVINPDKPVVDPAECYTAFGYSVNYDVKIFAPGLVLDFYSKASPEAVEWKWDFGDGTTSNEANPMHIFNFPVLQDGTLELPNPYRKVCLTVKTKTGCITSYCETINIYMEKIPKEEPATTCHAWFKYYKATDVITIPEVIPYRLLDVSEGKVVKRLWKFEDGKTSTEAEPLVTFDFMKPTQKVCLTIETEDGCSSTWCEVIYVSEIKPDTIYTKPAIGYSMRYESSFPAYMSSCAGWAKAQVYLNGNPVKADHYVWSTGEEGQEVKGLCPTRSYTVKAITPDGTIVSGTFIINSSGTVTEVPVNWYITGARDNWQIQYDLSNENYTVEWRLCDGTIVRSDSIPLNSINCGTPESNLILKDAAGNVIYTENISLKSLATFVDPKPEVGSLKLFPNPVNEVLNIRYAGNSLKEMQLEISDMAGKRISTQKWYDIESGQQISLNVSSLRKGIYILRMSSGNHMIGIEKFSK